MSNCVKSKKITFLFGAGAETSWNFNLPSGLQLVEKNKKSVYRYC